MKRTIPARTPPAKGRPTALITSDIEIRDYAPACRTDDFAAALCRKLDWIRALQKELDYPPILDGGDLFDKRYRSHPSYAVLQIAQDHLPSRIVTVPGNHDLPGHALENYDRSAMAILDRIGGRITVASPERPVRIDQMDVWGFPYRLPAKPPDIEVEEGRFAVALVHAMVIQGKGPYPGAEKEASQARSLLRLFRSFDLVVCGHNHQSFVEEHKGRFLVNPGSLMRADSHQADYHPRIFAWYAERRELRPIPVPHEPGVVSRAHLSREEARDERLEAFLAKLSEDGGKDRPVSFEQNLRELLAKAEPPVREKAEAYYESSERN